MSACSVRPNYNDSAKTIEIVLVGEDKDNCQETHTFMEIENIDSFLDDFSNLKPESSIILGSPEGVKEGSLAFKVTFENNDYNIIAFDGKARFTSGTNTYHYESGWDIYDYEEFEAFLMKYLNEEELNEYLITYYSSKDNYIEVTGKIISVDGSIIDVEISNISQPSDEGKIGQILSFKMLGEGAENLKKGDTITFKTSFKYCENSSYPIVSLILNDETLLDFEAGINLLLQKHKKEEK